MQPHKHQKLIVAWANGAQIDSKTTSGKVWALDPTPDWHNNKREFRIHIVPLVAGKWYQVIYKNSGMLLYCHNDKANKPLMLLSEHPNEKVLFAQEEFSWVGQPLELTWPSGINPF